MSANKKDLQRGRLAVVFDTEEGINWILLFKYNYYYYWRKFNISVILFLRIGLRRAFT